MFEGSHSWEGLYIEWLWGGRDEPKVPAHGENYRKEESQRREAKDEKVESTAEKIYFCIIYNSFGLKVLEKKVGDYFNPYVLTVLSWTCSISITWELVGNEILGP